MPFDEEELDPHGECAAEIARLQSDRALLIELVLDDTLTPAAKNCVAIAIRDGGLAPTDETLATVAARVAARR